MVLSTMTLLPKRAAGLLARAARSTESRAALSLRQARAMGSLPLVARGAAVSGAATPLTASVARFPAQKAYVRFSSTSVAAVAVGDRVSLHMEGKLSGGETLPRTRDGEPLTFVVGSGAVLPGVEDEVQGMKLGEKKQVEISAAKAFGAEPMVMSVPLKEMQLPQKEREMLAVGQILELQGGQRARIVKLTEDTMDIDLAHPYAGQSLSVELELVEYTPFAELSADQQLVLPEEISAGDGVTFPERGDTMVMHYTGKLADGKVFDSSLDRGEPFQFQIGVGQVIRGWDEGVMRMSKGQKATLNIPAAKGYGSAGAGGVIPPDADLVFEVELLDIKRR